MKQQRSKPWEIRLLERLVGIFGHKRQAAPVSHQFYREQWDTIMHLGAGGPSQLRQALVEADKLLDHALRDLGITGESLADRLRTIEKRLQRDVYQNLWEAHKLRNSLVHEVGMHATPQTIKTALRRFEQGLRQLGVLQ